MGRIVLAVLLAILTRCFFTDNAPQVFPAVVHEVCSSAEERAAIREQVTEQLLSLLNISSESQPPCACGGPGQWTRIAHLNMSDPSQQCPSNWNTITTPVRGCYSLNNYGCRSALFPSNGQSYSQVCGRANAYQRGRPVGFFPNFVYDYELEEYYVDGVSLTHGAGESQQHIWTFVAALFETGSSPVFTCPCSNINVSWPYEVPEFVGDDYFCDSGNSGTDIPARNTVFADDPLWDGEGCGPTSTCCEFNNPPWFCTTLPQPTTDDIEVRICGGYYYSDYSTILDYLEINIK